MHDANANASIENRRAPRGELDGKVTVRFDVAGVSGAGRNIAEQGVYLTAEVRVPVTVEIDGHDGALLGELVRIESLGDGRLGIAVRFTQPATGLAP